jgi:hypothetical protein
MNDSACEGANVFYVNVSKQGSTGGVFRQQALSHPWQKELMLYIVL